METFQKFFSLVKVDEANRFVYGLVTAERRDKDGETCHYESTKPEYKAVNDELGKASDGQNIMPLREMHQLSAVGCGKSIDFDDAKKEIRLGFKVVDDTAWNKVLQRVYLGFSQGGRYIKRWTENGVNYYTAQPGEVSLVDNPCLPGAYIEYGKADGTVEYFRPSQLTDDDLARVSKAVVSELRTDIREIRVLLDRSVDNTGTGDTMKPEDIKKCAAALEITEEEFTKRMESFSKKASLASLHSHLEKLHGNMSSHHEAHVAHVEKCMKACKDMMGSEEDAEKAIKALNDDLAKIADPVKPADSLTKAEAEELIKAAVAQVLEKLPKEDAAGKTKVFSVERGGVPKEVQAGSPYPGL